MYKVLNKKNPLSAHAHGRVINGSGQLSRRNRKGNAKGRMMLARCDLLVVGSGFDGCQGYMHMPPHPNETPGQTLVLEPKQLSALNLGYRDIRT